MKYVMTIERRAMERGKKEGKKEGSIQTAREALLAILTARFSTAPQELIEQIHKLTDLEQLKALLQRASVIGSLEEFEHIFRNNQRLENKQKTSGTSARFLYTTYTSSGSPKG